jgi:hypothetical protein
MTGLGGDTVVETDIDVVPALGLDGYNVLIMSMVCNSCEDNIFMGCFASFYDR